jgi:hypothetical protein
MAKLRERLSKKENRKQEYLEKLNCAMQKLNRKKQQPKISEAFGIFKSVEEITEVNETDINNTWGRTCKNEKSHRNSVGYEPRLDEE